MKKFLKWGGIAFAILIVLGVIGSFASDEETSSSTNNNQEVVSEEESEDNSEEQEKTEEVVVVDITEFVEEFDKNQLAAEDTYEGKTVEFTGYVGNISEDIMGSYYVIVNPTDEDYYFGTAVQCFFKDKSALTSLENGQQVTLKGNFDTQLMNVMLKKCEVLE